MCLRKQTLGILVYPGTTNISLNVHESCSLCLASVSAVTWPRFAVRDETLWQLLAAVHKRLDNIGALMFHRVWQPGAGEIYISWTKWGGFRAETIHADANWRCGIVPSAAKNSGFTSGAASWSCDWGTRRGRSPLLLHTALIISLDQFQWASMAVGTCTLASAPYEWALISSDVSICWMCPFGAVGPLWSNLILKKRAGRNTRVCSADTLRWSHTEQTELCSPPETPGAGLPRHLSHACLRAPPRARTHARADIRALYSLSS